MLDRLTNTVKAHAASLDHSAGQAKFGTVTSVDPATGNARVIIQPDGVLSGWLPVVATWVGNGWGMVCPLSPGDQVLLLPQEGDVEQNVILGRIYSASENPPVAAGGEFWLVHQSGSSFKLVNDGTIRICGDLHVLGDVYDRHGPLSRLRGSYNSHTHAIQSGSVTTTPSLVD